ncbi:MAG: C39 family peptidase [Clostridia bacterium]|nr:C39 family peptidase [Clostridia bacterium]
MIDYCEHGKRVLRHILLRDYYEIGSEIGKSGVEPKSILLLTFNLDKIIIAADQLCIDLCLLKRRNAVLKKRNVHIKKMLICIIFLFAVICMPQGTILITGADETETTEKSSFNQIPEVMEEDEELLKGSILRIDTEEDPLNVIRYLDSWNSQKTILFPVDVKYIDPQGVTRDKSNQLYLSNKHNIAFETRNNDILTYFSNYSQDGIITSYQDYTITVCPDSEENSEAEIVENNSVLYKNAFGDGIDFMAAPTFNGNKIDIILNTKPETNSFSLKVNIPNCYPSFIKGSISFNCGDEIICSFAEVYIKDSAGRISFGSFEVVDSTTISIIVPEDFLDSNNIIYPVVVDPVLYFVTNHVYNGDNINTAQMNTFLCISGGYVTKSSVMMFGQTGTTSFEHPIIRFPQLYAVIQNMDNIQNASLALFRESKYNGSNNTTITAKPITSAWTETYYNSTDYTSLFYSTTSNYNSTSNLKAGANATGANSFNITNLLNYWRQGNWINGYGVDGISFDIGTYAYPATFHGGLTATSSKMPRLSITHSYTSTGLIQDGIYFISPTTSFAGGTTNLYLTRTVDGGTATRVMSSRTRQNYPSSNSGYISYIRDLNQLYKIEYSNVGYTIKCMKTDQFLAFQNSSLCYTANDDTIYFTTRWSFVRVNEKYYIVSSMGHFLSVSSPGNPSDVEVNNCFYSDGILWKLSLYCLDVEHLIQQLPTSCGPSSARTVINYLGVDVTALTDTVIEEYGETVMNQSFQREQIPIVINHYAQISSYSWHEYDDWTQDAYSDISYSLNQGMPVVLNNHINTTTDPFRYTAGGHYLVLIGTYSIFDGISTVNHFVLCDPHYNTAPNKPDNIKVDCYIDITDDVFEQVMMCYCIIGCFN